FPALSHACEPFVEPTALGPHEPFEAHARGDEIGEAFFRGQCEGIFVVSLELLPVASPTVEGACEHQRVSARIRMRNLTGQSQALYTLPPGPIRRPQAPV